MDFQISWCLSLAACGKASEVELKQALTRLHSTSPLIISARKQGVGLVAINWVFSAFLKNIAFSDKQETLIS